MQIDDASNNMKIKQNAYDTLSPLIWLLKIFSLNSNADRLTNSKFLFVKSGLSATLFGSLTVFGLYYKFVKLYSGNSSINVSVRLTDVVQMIYDICQYIVDLVFVYKYGRYISMEYFKQYDNIDKILGVTIYSPTKRRVKILIIFFTSIWLISSTCDYVAWMLGYGWFIPTVYSITYVFLYIKILTTLDLTSHTMNIEMRLKIIGDYVQDYYSTAECYTGLIADSILCNRNWLYFKACTRSSDLQSRNNPLKLTAINNHHEVKCLTRCYLMLTEQVAFVNRMYGLRILLNSLSLLIDMVRFTNLGVRILIGLQHIDGYSEYFPAYAAILRLLTCVAVLVSLAEHCEQTYSQRVRIIRITDHLLINKNPGDDLRSATKELRELVQDRPISFDMADFFTLNYTLLMSIASIVVTYTIILLQS